jgi:hypothetical protein
VESVADTHCLDACAVIAYLRQEPGAEVLKALIELPNTFLAMHVCHLGDGGNHHARHPPWLDWAGGDGAEPGA